MPRQDPESPPRPRLAVYTDYRYRSDGSSIYAEKGFALFLGAVADCLGGIVLAGRLDPDPGGAHYRLPPAIDFVPLPHYQSLAEPRAAAAGILRSLRRLWHLLDRVDGVWVLGPHPPAMALALLAAARRRRVVLGVRQDYPSYVRSRHPGRPALRLAALLFEAVWRLMARRFPVVVVGPDLEHRYRRARRVLGISVSLLHESDLERGAVERSYDGDLRVLSVGRLEPEKAPLLLAEVLSRLRVHEPRWRLVVCGEGPLRGELVERLDELSLRDHAEIRGYVPIDDGLLQLYRDSHFFLHVSLTEGLPQVLLEAFAARLPVVATAVGGVPRAAAGCALLVPPGDADAAAAALRRLAAEAPLRDSLTEAGASRVAGRTIDAESARVAEFLRVESAGPS